ncbi:hypothetical protein M378DRAFT_168265 [Amanita muscaria Koide BX008]|uniref:Cytochrome P450 n=1 Tax=Amanita muscaria (strain Koide BX008) TaxID=946122 RepID=A0A0C2WV89_AMAMK|nr:hypothetical protein M378DRAFT_168265 [Amanita muscaria Koide BX008]
MARSGGKQEKTSLFQMARQSLLVIVVPFNPVHTDGDNYVNPDKFDGFRFERMRTQEGEEAKHQLLSLGVDYVLFGHGRHACPGRFFVVNELKVMLARVLLNYDIKMVDGRGRGNLGFILLGQI